MTGARWTGSAPAFKDLAPRRVKDLANVGTRAYGVATARWRPHPDFLIVGAKRGGTTSLWNYLVGHPQVLPMFPSVRGLKSNAYFFEHRHRGDRWYRSHFHATAYRRWKQRRLGPVVTGEASPYYMYGPHVPELIVRRMPGVRLIMLLRDPVARAYGHYQERVQQGVEHLPFEAALAAEPARLDGEWERMAADPSYYSRAHDFFSYRDRGIYLPQLTRIFACFPRDRVLIVRSEDLYVDQDAVFGAVCRFLDIAPVPISKPARHNYIPRSPIPAGARRELAGFYAPHNAALYRYLGRDFSWDAVGSG
jgi:Sulfotransferase family